MRHNLELSDMAVKLSAYVLGQFSGIRFLYQAATLQRDIKRCLSES
jgi:hypothetical protein